jgi:hypothetical protein
MEVTLTSTTQITVLGVPVIVKLLLVADVVFEEVVKKVVAVPSCLAVTSILTPLGGMADFISTFRGKSGPGAGASVAPLAGVISTDKFTSFEPPPPSLLLQAGKVATAKALNNKTIDNFLIIIYFIIYPKQIKLLFSWWMKKSFLQ